MDRIENPEINPYIYVQSVLNNTVKAIQQGKNSFQHMALGENGYLHRKRSIYIP